MPTLLETQRAARVSLLDNDSRRLEALLSGSDHASCVDIYRNTVLFGLVKTLQLSYPVVERLVGADFFAAAAEEFARVQPPLLAYLDRYGDGFDAFLRDFAPASSVPYLADVARLEWAINVALHAPDDAPLDLRKLEDLALEEQARVSFAANPSVSTIALSYPADALWRAVVDRDDDALAGVDIDSGPVWLLIERGDAGVTIARMERDEWTVARQILSGVALSALNTPDQIDLPEEIARHLAAGRIASFTLRAPDQSSTTEDTP
ncbi:MAG: putative DNA-binding domain-containing protein [Proteobacteria bacterium]|nr:putative DNA-binding domain-containing protein [Pseudomonadota bacterium]